MKTDTAGIPKIQINQLRTIVQNICNLNKEEHIIGNLTDNGIVLAIKGKTAMESIGQKSHATKCKLKKEENWDE
eukprot:3541051-Ditylum_brightwellii.AAC.1